MNVLLAVDRAGRQVRRWRSGSASPPRRCRSPRAASSRGSTSTRTAYFCDAEHVHLRDAADHRDALRDDRLRDLVERRERQRRRAQDEEEDRLIGRVDLLVRRRRRHLRRQLPRRAADHRLHVLRGGVDVAAQVELQRDVGAALRAGRVDAGQAGDGRELLLERQRHRRRPSSRGWRPAATRCTWMVGKSTLGRSATGSCLVGQRAEHQDAQHEQRRRDRPLDEECREVHGAPSVSGRVVALCPLTLMRLPGTSRSWPSVTTVSPGSSAARDHGLGRRWCASTVDRAQLHRLVRLDDEHVRALLAGLHGDRRHDDRVRVGRQRRRRR